MDNNNRYVAIKLCSGENVLGIMMVEEEDRIIVLHPMQIKQVTDYSTDREHLIAHPLCPFSEEQQFLLFKKDIIFTKTLSDYLIPFYVDAVKEFGESDVIRSAKQGMLDKEEQRKRDRAEAMEAILARAEEDGNTFH
jgi:hypothetical protein